MQILSEKILLNFNDKKSVMEYDMLNGQEIGEFHNLNFLANYWRTLVNHQGYTSLGTNCVVEWPEKNPEGTL